MDYPFEEFLGHYDAFSRLEHDDTAGLEMNVVRLMEALEPSYRDRNELIDKVSRFAMVMHYVAHHMSDFDIGD